MKTISFFTALVIATACLACSTYQVCPLGSSSLEEGELSYYLPQKTYRISITYDKIVQKKGSLMDSSAKAHLDELPVHIRDRIHHKNDTYLKVKSVSISSQLEPDTKKQYRIKLKGRNNPFYTKKVNFDFNSNGLIATASSSTEEHATNIALAIANLVGTVFKMPIIALSNVVPQDSVHSIESRDNETPSLSCDSLLSLSDGEKVICRLNGLQERRRYLLEKADNHNNITALLNEIAKEENKLIPLIAGTTSISTHKQIEYFTPNKSPFDTTLVITESGADTTSFKLNIDTTSSQKKDTPPPQGTDTTSSQGTGIVFRQPAYCTIKVIHKEEELTRLYDYIPQLGQIAYLPNRVGWFKNDLTIAFDPNSGALINFAANSEAVPSASIDKVTSFIDSTHNQNGVSQRISETKKEIEYIKLKRKLDSLSEGSY